MKADRGPYTGDYNDSIIRERPAGAPLERMYDVSEEFLGRQKGGALLMTSGVPDFVLTPVGLSAGLKANGFDELGICDQERCDVLKIYGNPGEELLKEVGFAPCGVCKRLDQATRVWKVKHRRTEVTFNLLECNCGQINWIGPHSLPMKEADRG